ncbi:hypothetical protein BC826DRAFT_972676 [Russula brevipes]|nr:hypothetical protein BC826DRAFT_972676 [Russula brevipes]
MANDGSDSSRPELVVDKEVPSHDPTVALPFLSPVGSPYGLEWLFDSQDDVHAAWAEPSLHYPTTPEPVKALAGLNDYAIVSQGLSPYEGGKRVVLPMEQVCHKKSSLRLDCSPEVNLKYNSIVAKQEPIELTTIAEEGEHLLHDYAEAGAGTDWLTVYETCVFPRSNTPRPSLPDEGVTYESQGVSPVLESTLPGEAELWRRIQAYERELQTVHVIQGRPDMQQFVDEVIRENPDMIRSPSPLPIPPRPHPTPEAETPIPSSKKEGELTNAAEESSTSPSEHTRETLEMFAARNAAPKGLASNASLDELGWHPTIDAAEGEDMGVYGDKLKAAPQEEIPSTTEPADVSALLNPSTFFHGGVQRALWNLGDYGVSADAWRLFSQAQQEAAIREQELWVLRLEATARLERQNLQDTRNNLTWAWAVPGSDFTRPCGRAHAPVLEAGWVVQGEDYYSGIHMWGANETLQHRHERQAHYFCPYSIRASVCQIPLHHKHFHDFINDCPLRGRKSDDNPEFVEGASSMRT